MTNQEIANAIAAANEEDRIVAHQPRQQEDIITVAHEDQES